MRYSRACLRNALEALVEQINASFFLILDHIAAKCIVRVYRRTLFLETNKSEGTAVKHIETAVLIQCLVAAAAAFLQYAHGYKNTDRGIGTTVFTVRTAICEQGAEDFLVYVAGHFTEELVVPCRRVIIPVTFTSTHQVGR